MLALLHCALQLLGPRRRTVVDYREKNMLRKIGSDDNDSDFDGEEGSGNKRCGKAPTGDDADGAAAEVQDGDAERARKKSKKVTSDGRHACQCFQRCAGGSRLPFEQLAPSSIAVCTKFCILHVLHLSLGLILEARKLGCTSLHTHVAWLVALV